MFKILNSLHGKNNYSIPLGFGWVVSLLLSFPYASCKFLNHFAFINTQVIICPHLLFSGEEGGMTKIFYAGKRWGGAHLTASP